MAPRVISGTAKGRRLKLVPGDTTRPIMDRVKESLFNILGDVREMRWLDLYAGTGQVGIEALSRGASEVVFIDNARAAVQTIRDNLVHTRLQDGAVVAQKDALAYLDDTTEPFDVIYIAPPQYLGMWIDALRRVDANPERYLNTSGLAIIQIDPREYQDLNLSTLTLNDQRRYGNTLLCFYQVGEAK